MSAGTDIDKLEAWDAGAPRERGSLLGQALRYGVTGLANTALGYGLILGLHYGLGAGIALANVVGYAAGLCLSFTLNRRWTFGHAGHRGRAMALFLALVLLAFLANLGLILALTGAGLAYPVSQALGAATYSILVFLGMRYAVFAD